jgi:small subunit ribosomal protein S17
MKEKKQKEKSEKPTKKGKKKVKKLVSTRGRIFKGIVIGKFPKRVTIEFERTVYIPKYERFLKKNTKIHARLPEDIDADVGDYVKIQECRPLSKIIHFLVVEKISSAEKEEE